MFQYISGSVLLLPTESMACQVSYCISCREVVGAEMDAGVEGNGKFRVRTKREGEVECESERRPTPVSVLVFVYVSTRRMSPTERNGR
jgi:hypothetical protein